MHSVEDCMNFTSMNASSSRSHAVFMAKVEKRIQQNLDEVEDAKQNSEFKDLTMTRSTLYLVDLAGSERVGKTKASGNRFDEAKNINLSLLALGNVIQALSDGKSKYIPFRDSKLTRILEQSLGGNSRTSMIITIGPSPTNFQESLSSLLFGTRAMKIQNTTKVNMEIDYKALCSRLQAEVDKLNDGKNINNIEYEKFIEENSMLKAQIDKLSIEKDQLDSLLEELKKGTDDSVIEFNNEKFVKIKKYYRNKLEKQDQEHKLFTQEVNKLLLEQEEKMIVMRNKIEELENINQKLESDLVKNQQELEIEKNDREKKIEELLNELFEHQRINADRTENELANDEILNLIDNHSASIKSIGNSIQLSNKLRASMSPRPIDIEQLRAKFKLKNLSPPLDTNQLRPSFNVSPLFGEDLNEKLKTSNRIINNLEDKLLELDEQHKLESKKNKKELVRLIKAYKKLEKKYEDEKALFKETIMQKDSQIALISSRAIH